MQTSGQLIYTLRIGKQIYTDNGVGDTLILLEGREEISAPFYYSVLLGSVTPLNEASMIDSTAALDISLNSVSLVRTVGIVTGVSYTRQYPACKPGKYWYSVRLAPPIVKACYTRNRCTYTAEETPANAAGGFVAHILEKIGNAYQTEVKVSAAAAKRLPSLIQLLQKDESDYNFIARILYAFGLGYVIKTNDKGIADSEQWTSELHVLDMAASDDTAAVLTKEEQGKALSMTIASSSVPQWRRTLGFAQVATSDCTYTPYGSPRDNAKGSVVNIIEAPGSQEESCIKANTAATISSSFLAHHNNTGTARGCVENVPVSLGRAVTRDAAIDSSDTNVTYKVSKIRLVATGTTKIKTDLWARLPMNTGSALGLCPAQLTTDDKPDTSSDTLEQLRLQKMPPTVPGERLFPAVVCSSANYSDSVRHLCKVREVGGTEGQKNEFWVEVGSLFADVNSGIHVRPRVGNVLLCSDPGDFGMPVAVSSLYRGDNTLPSNTLMGKGGDKESTEVDSTLTISNRSHNSSKETDGSVGSVADITRPCSVYDLREQKGTPNCSRIQITARNNKVDNCPDGTPTILRSTSLKYSFCALPEIILGIPMGKNAYLNSPILDLTQTGKVKADSRPFLQGINIYAEKDLLQQSADSHFINAGGSIRLTAAEKITLRVGRNSITISESGITIQNGYGSVKNPGASALYNKSNPEDAKSMSMGFVRKLNNTVSLKQDGISIYGTCSASRALCSVNVLSTVGSGMGITNTKTGISAPAITMTGGAALASTVEKVGKMLFKESMNYADPTATATCLSAYNYATTVWSYVRKGIPGLKSQFTNLFSVKGAQLSLKPTSVSFSSDKLFFESKDIYLYCHPLANYRAFTSNAVSKYCSKFTTWITSRFSLSKHFIVPGVLEMNTLQKLEAAGTEERTAGNVKSIRLNADEVIAKKDEDYIRCYNNYMRYNQQAVDHNEQDVNEEQAAVIQEEQNPVNNEVGANNNNASGTNMVNGVEIRS